MGTIRRPEETRTVQVNADQLVNTNFTSSQRRMAFRKTSLNSRSAGFDSARDVEYHTAVSKRPLGAVYAVLSRSDGHPAWQL